MHLVHSRRFIEEFIALSLETPEAPQQGPPVRTNPKADAKAAKAYAKAMRPWYKKKRFLLPLGLVLLIVAVSAGSSGSADKNGTGGTSGASSNDGGGGTSGASNEKPAAQEKPAAEKKPEMTSGQKNALQAGENYLDTLPFSKAGLIQQLSSSAGDGFSKADATFAANHVGADWNKQAVKAAKNYLDTLPFSKAGLIQQLSSSAGDKYTPAQARYAASKVY